MRQDFEVLMVTKKYAKIEPMVQSFWA